MELSVPGDPNFFSITTFLPLGPKVTLTLMAGAAAADYYIDQARPRLERIEAEFASMAAGDNSKASQLMRQLRYVSSDLNNSTERSSDEWQDLRNRYQDLAKSIPERAAAEPVVEVEPEPIAVPEAIAEPEQAEETVSEPEPVVDEVNTPTEEETTAEEEAQPLTSQDENQIRFFDRTYQSATYYLNSATPTDLQDETNVAWYDNKITQLRETLAKVENSNNPEFAERQTKLDEFIARVNELTGEGNEMAEALGDIDAQIELFRSEIPDTWSAVLEKPHTEERVRVWVDDMIAMREIIKEGSEYMQQVKEGSDRYNSEPDLKRYVNWFINYLPSVFEREIEETVHDWPLAMQQHGLYWKPEDITDDRILMEGWAKLRLEGNALAQDAAKNLLVYHSGYLGDTDVSELQGNLAYLENIENLIREKYADALADIRMPPAVSSDEGLLATARQLLEDDGMESYRALRINYPVTRKRDTRWYEGRLWLRVWDEYQCAAAQQINGEWRIVYFNFRKDHQNVNNTDLGYWYFTGRMKSTPILEEYIR